MISIQEIHRKINPTSYSPSRRKKNLRIEDYTWDTGIHILDPQRWYNTPGNPEHYRLIHRLSPYERSDFH